MCITNLCYKKYPKLAVSRKHVIKAWHRDLVTQRPGTAPGLTLMPSKGSQIDTQIRTGKYAQMGMSHMTFAVPHCM